MRQSEKWSSQVCIEKDGEMIPYLEIDSEGNITLLVSEEEQQQYESKMLDNMGESMSRFYAAHPEYLVKESDYENRQKPA